MRRTLALAAALAAAALIMPVTPAAATAVPQVKFVCTKSGGDVCISQYTLSAQTVGHTRYAVGTIWVTVNHRPRHLNMTVHLQWWDQFALEPFWATEDEQTYTLADLPAKGHTAKLTPDLVEACRPLHRGTFSWRLAIHVVGVTHDGKAVPPYSLYLPGPHQSSRGKRLECEPR